MTFVQVAHGGNQADGFSLLAIAAEDGSQFFQGMYGSHALNVCSSAGECALAHGFHVGLQGFLY